MAITYLHRRYAAHLYGYLLQVLESEYKARHCLTEAFVTFWRQLPEASYSPAVYHRLQTIVVQLSRRYA